MQSYKTGLSQALAKHEDQLKAQRAPAEGGSAPGLECDLQVFQLSSD